jgi:phage terminase small subunit
MDELIIADQEVLTIRPVKVRKPISPNSLIGKRKDGKPKEQKLTGKMKKFFKHWFIEGKSARSAALLAGYSPNTANVASSALAKNPTIVAEVRKVRQESAKLNEITNEMIIDNLTLVAESNIADYYDIVNGKPVVNLESLSREQAAAIKEIYYDTSGYPQIILHDKIAANIQLHRMKNSLKDGKPFGGEEGQQITVQYIDSLVQNHTTNIQNNSFRERESRLLQQSE